jgi:uncharacterized protein YegP (UPF0339 family)
VERAFLLAILPCYRPRDLHRQPTGGGVPAKFEVYKDKGGEYRWRLKSGNGQVIATGGEGYTSKAGVENGIAAVKRDAPAAPVAEV